MAQMKTLTINGKKYVIVGAEGIPEDVNSGLTASISEDGTKLSLSWREGTGSDAAAHSVKIPLGTELTEEDAAKLGRITVTEEGYTDISGLPQATGISMVAADNVITVTTTLEGGAASTSEITLDDNGYPATIVTDGVECGLSWEGFDV